MGYSEKCHLEDTNTYGFPQVLLDRVGKLPKRECEQLVFVDFDDTLFNADSRYDIDPELRNHRGNTAYPYIISRFGTFSEFFRQLNPDNHIFDNTSDFYDPTNPQHVILTAGNIEFQNQKIKATRFNAGKRILVIKSERKPEVMLHYLIRLGYLPGEIHFYDDRIHNFKGVDSEMNSHLGIPVIFHRVTPTEGGKNVLIQAEFSKAIHSTLSSN